MPPWPRSARAPRRRAPCAATPPVFEAKQVAPDRFLRRTEGVGQIVHEDLTVLGQKAENSMAPLLRLAHARWFRPVWSCDWCENFTDPGPQP